MQKTGGKRTILQKNCLKTVKMGVIFQPISIKIVFVFYKYIITNSIYTTQKSYSVLKIETVFVFFIKDRNSISVL
jgi:hypothetical protein